jgi:hypothetical protein
MGVCYETNSWESQVDKYINLTLKNDKLDSNDTNLRTV